MRQTRTDTQTHASPSLLALAVVHTLLLAACVATLTLLQHGAESSSLLALNPYGPPEPARSLFATNPQAIRISAFFLFGSAIPLGVYTATIVSRLRFLGLRAAGVDIAYVGGLAASVALAAAGLCLWLLSIPEASASTGLPITHIVHFLTFLSGGVAFSAGFGLLIAGVSVTSYFAHFLPRWIVWFGLVIAALGELATLSLITISMTPAIPVTRVGGIIWLIAVGALMPKRLARPE
jgi:hypothetical protein